MPKSNPGPRQDFPDGWIGAAKRDRQLEAMAKSVEEGARAAGLPELEAEMAQRATAIREGRRDMAKWLHVHRRAHAHTHRRTLPRARARRARAAARTGASSSSAGADPPQGDDDDEPEPASAGSWLNFETFHRLTPGCSGSERLSRFLKLSPEIQDRTWRALARDLEEMRA